MSEKIVSLDRTAPLVPAESGGYPNVIEFLERYLEQAKRGEITACALIFLRPNEKVGNDFTATPDAHAMVAGCVYLQHEFMMQFARD